jgi:hypothetical protein
MSPSVRSGRRTAPFLYSMGLTEAQINVASAAARQA